MIASAAMTFSSVSVIGNALRLRRARCEVEGGGGEQEEPPCVHRFGLWNSNRDADLDAAARQDRVLAILTGWPVSGTLCTMVAWYVSGRCRVLAHHGSGHH